MAGADECLVRYIVDFCLRLRVLTIWVV
jgi:hypothetical protein